jgi:pyruvate/2-oxoglutarate dehydrogenase complex dihydrolipoamide dehydrogenase (E3) component
MGMVSQMPEFDVVVLGGGTAGVHVAAEVAAGGRSVALVEAGLVGGESPYLACLPSKTLLEAAGRGEAWENAVARRDEVTSHLDDSSAAGRLTEAGVTLLRGTGQVTRPGTVAVTTYPENGVGPDGTSGPGPTVELSYTDLVLSTGSEPVAPPIEGLADIAAWTSAEAMSGPDLPRRLVVLGGGSAGCELAQIYASFGSQVTLVEAEKVLLPAEATFTGEILAEALRRTGVDVRLGSAAVKAERLDEEGLALTLADGSRIEADRVLLATGRRPRVGGLGLNALGVEVKPGTAIPVDTTCRVVTRGGASPTTQTTDRATDGPAPKVTGEANGRATETNRRPTGLWAAGDVTGLGTHTHTARYQAGVVAANILGRRREADYRAIPRAVYTMPSVFAVGASPQGAAEAGITLVCAGADLQTTARALVAGVDTGRVELYAHPDSKLLLGAAAVGPNAPDWMGELTVAIRAGVPLPVLADTVHAFPTYSEALEPVLRELAGKLATQPGDTGTSREGPEPTRTVLEGTVPDGTLPEGTVPNGTGPNGTGAPAGSDHGDDPVPLGAQNGDAGMRPAALAEPRGPEARGPEPRGSEPSNAANSDARSAAS